MHCSAEGDVMRLSDRVALCGMCATTALEFLGAKPRLVSTQPGLVVLRSRVERLKGRLDGILGGLTAGAVAKLPEGTLRKAGALQRAVGIGEEAVRLYEKREAQGRGSEGEIDLVLRLLGVVKTLTR